MKYNIHGFYQPRAVELGLSNDDLLVLRWFVDYAGTGKMRQIIIDNEIYYWVNYNTVLEELPVLKVSKQTLYKKHFTNLVNAEALKHRNVKEGGNFSYYCYGLNYSTLVYLEGGCVKNDDLVSKFTKPLCQNLPNPCVEIYQTNNNIDNNNSSIILNNKSDCKQSLNKEKEYKEKEKQDRKKVEEPIRIAPEVKEIYDYWQSKHIKHHRSLSGDIEKAIKQALKKYDTDTIKLGIDRYDTVYNDPTYYFNTQWGLDLFLKQGNALPQFIGEDKRYKWDNYINRNNKKNTITQSRQTNKQRTNNVIKEVEQDILNEEIKEFEI